MIGTLTNRSKIPGVAYGEVVLSNIVAVLMKIRNMESTSQFERQLLEGYSMGCQGTVIIRHDDEE